MAVKSVQRQSLASRFRVHLLFYSTLSHREPTSEILKSATQDPHVERISLRTSKDCSYGAMKSEGNTAKDAPEEMPTAFAQVGPVQVLLLLWGFWDSEFCRLAVSVRQ